MVVPGATSISRPSIVRRTGWALMGSRGSADARRTALVEQVFVELGAEVVEHGCDGLGSELAETADRRQSHRVTELVDQLDVFRAAAPTRDVGEHVDHLGGPDPARDTLAA